MSVSKNNIVSCVDQRRSALICYNMLKAKKELIAFITSLLAFIIALCSCTISLSVSKNNSNSSSTSTATTEASSSVDSTSINVLTPKN